MRQPELSPKLKISPRHKGMAKLPGAAPKLAQQATTFGRRCACTF
jgi:hypothetical protein